MFNQTPNKLKNEFRIFSAQSELPFFIVTRAKMLGSRAGSIGKFTHLSDPKQEWMIKVETQNKNGKQDYYPCDCAQTPEEAVALESIVSQMIRAMFENKYATNIQLMKVDDQSCQIPCIDTKMRFIQKSPLILSANTYCIISKWEENSSCLHSLNYHNYDKSNVSNLFIENITKIITIAKLFGVDDFKSENIIITDDTKLYLVDCAGSFCYDKNILDPKKDGFNLGFLFKREVALETIKTYCDFPQESIDSVLNNYCTILSNERISMIRNTIIANQEDLLKIYLQETQYQLITKESIISDITNKKQQTDTSSFDFFNQQNRLCLTSANEKDHVPNFGIPQCSIL